MCVGGILGFNVQDENIHCLGALDSSKTNAGQFLIPNARYSKFVVDEGRGSLTEHVLHEVVLVVSKQSTDVWYSNQRVSLMATTTTSTATDSAHVPWMVVCGGLCPASLRWGPWTVILHHGCPRGTITVSYWNLSSQQDDGEC